MPLASIPSPSQGVWHLGPIPLRAYALCIVLGVIVAVIIGERRWRARGGAPGTITDLAVWAVPFGLVGGRLYHVITDWQLYFGADAPHRPIEALYIWNGGLGIWGAIALGAVGVWIGCRNRGISLSAVADTLAPAVVIAQAIGRWGNYFNQELFGGPTDLPWGLEIDPGRPGTVPGQLTYHPTFLYESLWDLALGLALIWIASRFALRHGRVFALYVAGYTVGRFWIEGLRVDPAHHILGLRLNQWTSIVIFIGAVAYLWLTRNKTTEESLGAFEVDPAHPAGQADAEETGAKTDAKTGDETGATGTGDEAPPEAVEAETAADPADPDPAHAAGQADPAPDPAHPAAQVDPDPANAASPVDPDPVNAAGQADPDPAHAAGPADPDPVNAAGQADETEADEADDAGETEAAEPVPEQEAGKR
jgi:prolipoprotein diacylglyceryl transferase